MNLDRCRVARIDLDRPRNPVAQDEIDAEPAGKAEAACERIAQRSSRPARARVVATGPMLPRYAKGEPSAADPLPGDADQAGRAIARR